MIGVLNKTCSTQRPTVVHGALGSARTYAGYHLEGVPCALQQRSAKELGSATSEGLSSLVAAHKLWFELGTDLLKTDRVIVDGVTYEVTGIDPDVAGVGHHGQAELLEVRA